MATVTEKRAIPKIENTQCFINNDWVDAASGQTFPTEHPATEEVICQVAEGDSEDVDRAVKAARLALDEGEWGRMDARARGKLLFALADLMEAESDHLAALETLDNGKPIRDARAADIPLAIECLRYYGGLADKIQGDTIPINGDYFCYTRREPVGVAGQIIPWNFPLLMAAWKWGPALAAGCAIVMKPAEQTPLSCLRMAHLAKQAGFPDGTINVIPGFGPTAGGAIVEHPDVDKVAFTGEHTTAQIIMRNAANTLKRLTFELGGKSPNIIFADADIDAAIEGAHFGLFFNQGQCCCAGSRVFVEEKLHDQFINRIAEINNKRQLGDPFDPNTEQGPQVDKAQFDKIMKYIDYGREEGAKCVTGGKRFGDKGYFVEPTVFDDVTDDMKIATDEIFGPVMSVLTFNDIDEVIQRGNNTFYGLAAAVWTRDVAKAHYMAKALKAGTVWVNCYDVFDAAAPFGGFKMSGIGRELGIRGLDAYLETKTVTVSMK
jgi:aldehyde dehydrogenase (NAD+)